MSFTNCSDLFNSRPIRRLPAAQQSHKRTLSAPRFLSFGRPNPRKPIKSTLSGTRKPNGFNTGLRGRGCANADCHANLVPLTDSISMQVSVSTEWQLEQRLHRLDLVDAARPGPRAAGHNKVRMFTRSAIFPRWHRARSANCSDCYTSAHLSLHAVPLDYTPFNEYLFLSIG
jgi:hypothetical protein